jgi:hypothetical protein
VSEPREAGVYKLSTILTSTRAGGTESFETLDDMPAVMRAECVRALESNQTATVLIADAAGREYLQRTMARETAAKKSPDTALRRFPWRLAAEIVFVGSAGLALWILATLR